MSGLGYVERALRELLDQSELSWAPLQAAQARWGGDVTEASHQSVRRALISLVQKGLIEKGIGSRYFALGIEQVWGSNLGR
jgi:hypothetical protein